MWHLLSCRVDTECATSSGGGGVGEERESGRRKGSVERGGFVEGEIMEDLNSNGRSERDTCCVHILSQRSSALNVREVQDSPHKSCMHR